MSRSFPDQTFQTQSCGDENEVKNWKNIQECANSTDGSNLLKENGHITEALNPKLTSVPTILFRNHYDYDAQKLAVENFPQALCKELKPQPAECQRSGAAAKTVLVSLTLVAAFLASQMF